MSTGIELIICDDELPSNEDNDSAQDKKGKSLKQVRLPFSAISPAHIPRKRKLSEGDVPPTKSPRTNVGLKKKTISQGKLEPVCLSDNEVSSSSEDHHVEKKQTSKPGLMDIYIQQAQQREVSTSNLENIENAENISPDDSTKGDESMVEDKDNADESKNESMLDESVASIASGDVSINADSGKLSADTPKKESEVSSGSKIPSTGKLTRKEQKFKEKQERQLERERQKLEREKKKQEEKEKKEQERLQKEKERLEKKEQQEKEKQEKLKVKEEEKRKKMELIEEERKKRDEEKKKKDEEKKKKEDEKRKKEEEKAKEEEEKMRKKEKQKGSFKNFFIKTDTTTATTKTALASCDIKFMQFQVKANMRLAPQLFLVTVDNKQERKIALDEAIESQSTEKLYIQCLKTKGYSRGKSSKTWPMELDSPDIEIVGEETPKMMKTKLLQFRENYRPAYYGTWRRKSKYVNPRNPFKKDDVLFDYDIDSDEEWEEEEPGESLSNSEGESDKDDKDEDDDIGEWMKPHGYLSADEGAASDDDDRDPDIIKLKQIQEAKIFEMELKNKPQKMIAVSIGCVWDTGSNADLNNNLEKYKAVVLDKFPIETDPPPPKDSSPKASGSNKKYPTKRPVPEEAMPDLIRLLHGNVIGQQKIIREFRAFFRQKYAPDSGANKSENMDTSTNETPNVASPDTNGPCVSKRQLELTIVAIATYTKKKCYSKKCWFVNDDILQKYNLTDLPVPTRWEYITKPNKKSDEDVNDSYSCMLKTPKSSKLIDKFSSPGFNGQHPPSSSTPKSNNTPQRSTLAGFFKKTTEVDATCDSTTGNDAKNASSNAKTPRRIPLITVSEKRPVNTMLLSSEPLVSDSTESLAKPLEDDVNPFQESVKPISETVKSVQETVKPIPSAGKPNQEDPKPMMRNLKTIDEVKVTNTAEKPIQNQNNKRNIMSFFTGAPKKDKDSVTPEEVIVLD